jgi:hypothetical protein
LTILIGVLTAGFLLINDYQIQPPGRVSAAGQMAGTDAGAGSAFANTRYDMKLYLDTGKGELYGQTNLYTINTGSASLKELWFTVYPNACKEQSSTPVPANAYYDGFNPGWLKITTLAVNNRRAAVEEQGVSVRVPLAEPILPGEAIKVAMEWEVKIPRAAYRFGSNRNVYMLGNFYPALNVLDRKGWHNSYLKNFGDPFCYACADYRVEVNLPQGYELVSTGLKQDTIADDSGRETRLVEALNARDFSMAVVYDYSQVSSNSANTCLTCYAPAECSMAVSDMKLLL